jgi:hypothetical protein
MSITKGQCFCLAEPITGICEEFSQPDGVSNHSCSEHAGHPGEAHRCECGFTWTEPVTVFGNLLSE